MTMGERFKTVRSLADEAQRKCTQSDFGKMFHISRDAVANIENGRVEPSPTLIENICHKFDISYDWLAYGLDPMRAPKTREEEISEMVGAALNGSNEFKKAVIRMICSRSDAELEALENAFRAVYENIKTEQ